MSNIPSEIMKLAPIAAESCIRNSYDALPWSLLYLGEEKSRPILIKALAQVLNKLTEREQELIPAPLDQCISEHILERAERQMLAVVKIYTAHLRQHTSLSGQDKSALLLQALANLFNRMAEELPAQVPDGVAAREEYFSRLGPSAYDPYQ